MEMASSPRNVAEIFKDYSARRTAVARALTYDVDEFYGLCDPEMGPLKEKHEEGQDSSLLLNGSEEFEAVSSSTTSSYAQGRGKGDDLDKLTIRAINALIVLGFGTFAVLKLLTIDHDYWHMVVDG